MFYFNFQFFVVILISFLNYAKADLTKLNKNKKEQNIVQKSFSVLFASTIRYVKFMFKTNLIKQVFKGQQKKLLYLKKIFSYHNYLLPGLHLRSSRFHKMCCLISSSISSLYFTKKKILFLDEEAINFACCDPLARTTLTILKQNILLLRGDFIIKIGN